MRDYNKKGNKKNQVFVNKNRFALFEKVDTQKWSR